MSSFSTKAKASGRAQFLEKIEGAANLNRQVPQSLLPEPKITVDGDKRTYSTPTATGTFTYGPSVKVPIINDQDLDSFSSSNHCKFPGTAPIITEDNMPEKFDIVVSWF